MTLPVALGAFDPIATPAGATTSGRTGAVNELRACAHLMHQGFDVFRCVAPHAPFDLVAHRDGQLYRVEVKTLTVVDEHWTPSFNWPVNDQWDLLIVCNAERVFQFAAGTTKLDARDEVRRAVGNTYREQSVQRRRFVPSATEALIREVFSEAPGAWSSAAMRRELESRGWSTDSPDKTAVVANTIRGMVRRGTLERIDTGMYQSSGGW